MEQAMSKQRSLAIAIFVVMSCLTSSATSAQGKQTTSKSPGTGGGVVISEILGYEYNNRTNMFSKNVVGAESSAVQGSGNHTLIVVKLKRNPNVEYKYIERTLIVTALYEEKGKTVEIFERLEVKVPLVDDTFYVPLIIQRGATQTTIKADLLEEGKLVSTKKQFLLTWAGD
jgi:hypothetical protein